MGTESSFVVTSSEGYRALLMTVFSKKLVLRKAGKVFWDTLSFYSNLKRCFRIFPREDGEDSDAKSQIATEIFGPLYSPFLKKMQFYCKLKKEE